jgi:predicted site-specific integrase-resolvase
MTGKELMMETGISNTTLMAYSREGLIGKKVNGMWTYTEEEINKSLEIFKQKTGTRRKGGVDPETYYEGILS